MNDLTVTTRFGADAKIHEMLPRHPQAFIISDLTGREMGGYCPEPPFEADGETKATISRGGMTITGRLVRYVPAGEAAGI